MSINEMCGIEISASCEVVTKEIYEDVYYIRENLRPVFYINGLYFACTVNRCEHAIGPGSRGNIHVTVMTGENINLFHPGAEFELREGPKNILSRCVIDEVIKEYSN